MLTQERLKHLLSYDPITGEWRWLNPTSYNVVPGQVAGTISFHGYLIITIGGVKHRASRLAQLYMTGSWPAEEMDHINRCKLDERWENLREVTRSENSLNRNLQANNTSGARGVHWDVSRSKWSVQVKTGGATYSVGRFDSFEEAVAARDSAAETLHGNFAVPNEKAS